MSKLYGALNPFTDKEYQELHESTLSILEKVGVYVDCKELLELAKLAGNKVDFERKIVRFPSDIVEKNIKGCRNSLDRRKRPDNLIFSCDGGGAFVLDYATMRQRPATIKDIADFSRMTDALENIEEISFPCFDQSIPYEIQDLTIFRQVWGNTSKSGGGGLSRNNGVWMNTSPEAIAYLIRLAKIRYGGDTRPNGDPLISGFVGASSPLRFDNEMMLCMLELVKQKQIVGIGSNVIGGAQAPSTLASVVVMENAERMAALSLVMAADPDAYMYFCNHPNYLDMVSANVANGSPEHSLMAMCATGLLNHYGFQLTANHPCITTGSHLPGIQAAVEKASHALLTGLSGASGVSVCGGLYEAMSYEQLVIDNEIAGMIRHYLKGMEVNKDTIHLDIIEELGIGENFMDNEVVAEEAHTAYWKPNLWNRRRYSEWIRHDGKDILEKAHDKAEDILHNHHPKPLSDDQEKAMDELIAEAWKVLVK